MCKNGQCIDSDKTYDDVTDCKDGDDESRKLCESKSMLF